MTDLKKLKREIFDNGYNNSSFAEAIGMSKPTFSRRMKNGKFTTDEAERIIRVLRLKQPYKIFFVKKLT